MDEPLRFEREDVATNPNDPYTFEGVRNALALLPEAKG